MARFRWWDDDRFTRNVTLRRFSLGEWHDTQILSRKNARDGWENLVLCGYVRMETDAVH